MAKDEALKMAIAEIEGWIDHAYGHSPEECADNKTIMACKEALEQPTVAELNDAYLRDTYVQGLNRPTWQGLTDDEISKLFVGHTAIDFARAIEQALKAKNG
jgi:hypothetical protein